MKKNVMMRVASIMLVLVLMSSSVISGTFAKYVTSGSGSDTARVAKWGVKVDANGELFLEDYAKTDGTYTVGTNTVESIDTWKLVAPGTNESLTEVQLTGTPEVATRVTYDATVVLGPWKLSDGTTEYCPIVFTVEGKTYGIPDDCGQFVDVQATDVADLKAKVEAAIEGCKADFAPNTNLEDAAVTASFPTVAWHWNFYVDDAHDVKDTDLGNQAADGYHSMIQIEIKTTVTQID